MKNKAGFTLIEVLVALAILSIALTAIIKTTSQNIKDTLYLQQKTFALWVASDIINEIRAGVIPVPEENTPLQDEKNMFDQEWPYQTLLQNTPNPHIKEITVDVFAPKTQTLLMHLESYLYAQS
jgi:general secretion pathway protein I